MKLYRLIFVFAVCLPVFLSCVKDDSLFSNNNKTIPNEGEEVKLSFLTNMLPEDKIFTRTAANITDLMILVFDENYRYLSRSKAILGGVDLNGDRKFEATLTSSGKNRYVHFVAGYDWTGFGEDYDLIGSDEGEIIPRLIVDESVAPTDRTTSYWARISLDGTGGYGTGITEHTFENRVVMLTRNRAKLTLALTPQVTNFTLKGYAVYNQPDKGSIAVFKYADGIHTFPDGVVTVPADAGQLDIPSAGDYVTTNTAIEFFEWDNNNDNSNIRMFVIFYGDYFDGMTTYNDCYYKLDFVDGINAGEVLNVVRNTHFHFDLNLIDAVGYSSAALAAAAPAGNNVFASLELREYPTVSDGTGMVRVTQLEDIITDASIKFSTEIYYIPDINSPTSYEPTGVTIVPINDTDETYWNLTTTIVGGAVSVEVGLIPGQTVPTTIQPPKIAEYKVTAGRVVRILTITARSPYQLNATTTLVGNPSLNPGAGMSIDFTVPGTISKSLFPLNLYIDAKFLSPNLNFSSEEIQVETGGGTYWYIYKIPEAMRGSTVTLHFRVNKDAGTNEVIKLDATPYFAPQTLTVSWT